MHDSTATSCRLFRIEIPIKFKRYASMDGKSLRGGNSRKYFFGCKDFHNKGYYQIISKF